LIHWELFCEIENQFKDMILLQDIQLSQTVWVITRFYNAPQRAKLMFLPIKNYDIYVVILWNTDSDPGVELIARHSSF
jgi:hypothetical protein